MFNPMTDTPSWQWATYETHRAALRSVWNEAACDEEIIGLLTCGSVARGDALPGSDLDVRVLISSPSAPRPFDAQTIADVWVERTYLTDETARQRLAARPMEVFPYREGRIIRDDTGQLSELAALARDLWENYAAPPNEKREMHYWLQATQRKVAAARESGQIDKASFVVATGAWPILTGLFLAASRPLPPSGAILANVPDAALRVGIPLETVYDLWTAETVEGRINAALVVLATILPQLEAAA